MTGDRSAHEVVERLLAFRRVSDAFYRMPYAGDIDLWEVSPPDIVSLDDAAVTAALNGIARNLEVLAETLGNLGTRLQVEEAELAKFRRWHQTLAEIAGSLGGAS